MCKSIKKLEDYGEEGRIEEGWSGVFRGQGPLGEGVAEDREAGWSEGETSPTQKLLKKTFRISGFCDKIGAYDKTACTNFYKKLACLRKPGRSRKIWNPLRICGSFFEYYVEYRQIYFWDDCGQRGYGGRRFE